MQYLTMSISHPFRFRARRQARSAPPRAALGVALLAVTLALSVACGGNGSNGGGMGGSPISPSTGGPGPVGATIRIANGAVSPTEVTINVGQSVTFQNDDGRAREMTSDPHPTHGQCPAINALGNLQPGQARNTHGFASAGTCGFHDHNDPDNPAVRGRIIVR